MYADYGSLGLIHLFHESLIPDATYTVEAVHAGCDAAEDSSFSRALTVRTAIWGDVAGSFDSVNGRWRAPDGSVDVPTDMLAVIDKFINKFGAPSTARTDIAPALPDGRIDMIPDLVNVIDAFRRLDASLGGVNVERVGAHWMAAKEHPRQALPAPTVATSRRRRAVGGVVPLQRRSGLHRIVLCGSRWHERFQVRRSRES